MSRSASRSIPCAGSITRPFLIRSPIYSPFPRSLSTLASKEHKEQRHSDRDPIRDLRRDNAVPGVRHLRADLQTAVHGAGMHHRHSGSRPFQPLGVDAEPLTILPERREKATLLTLELD